MAARIIPARAGFTACTGPPRRWSRDHPRSRGVYHHVVDINAYQKGSSPLARGLQAAERRLSLEPGIIPARAGFTRLVPGLRAADQDHPRSRGVYAWWSLVFLSRVGSSPLARGLLNATFHLFWDERIIPARAGFTPPPSGSGRRRGDHPRSRGVYKGHQGHRVVKTGSSPLARGLRRISV